MRQTRSNKHIGVPRQESRGAPARIPLFINLRNKMKSKPNILHFNFGPMQKILSNRKGISPPSPPAALWLHRWGHVTPHGHILTPATNAIILFCCRGTAVATRADQLRKRTTAGFYTGRSSGSNNDGCLRARQVITSAMA